MKEMLKNAVLTSIERRYDMRRARDEAARCLLCYNPPCSTDCPANTDPARFIRAVRFGNIKGAAEIIRENNVLGGSCAYICPCDRTCEYNCNRSKIDMPVRIGKLQQFVVEQEKKLGMQILKAPAERRNGRIACIGAGAASLACAVALAKEGYEVSVYEALAAAGGMLSYCILPSRLPQSVIDFDLSQVEKIGVKFIFNTHVGKDISFDKLRADYDAVFIGGGLWASRMLDIPGKELDGVMTAIQFLTTARKYGEKIGSDVIVVDGGDVAMECAVAAKQLGAKRVTVVYHRSLEEAPANMSELLRVKQMGISMVTEMVPVEILNEGNKVVGMRFEGRDSYSELKIKASEVVFAVGQTLGAIGSVVPTEKGLIAVNKGGQTLVAGVFAAGDAVNGGKTVTEAVNGGKIAAASILAYLRSKE